MGDYFRSERASENKILRFMKKIAVKNNIFYMENTVAQKMVVKNDIFYM